MQSIARFRPPCFPAFAPPICAINFTQLIAISRSARPKQIAGGCLLKAYALSGVWAGFWLSFSMFEVSALDLIFQQGFACLDMLSGLAKSPPNAPAGFD